jgi:DNA-binding MarR family transcriptional regulator
MNDSLSPKQRLVLLKLLFCEAPLPLEGMQPNLNKKERDELESLGLIRSEPRPDKRRAKQIALTDKGWGWAAENLESKSKLSKSPAANKVLQAVLSQLSRFLQSHSLTLADFYAPAGSQSASAAAPQPPVPEESGSQASVQERIRDAYLKLSGGHLNEMVRLADLKDALPSIPSPAVDEALLSMQQAGDMSLQAIESMQQTTDADRRAAIKILGEDRNTVYLVK